MKLTEDSYMGPLSIKFLGGLFMSKLEIASTSADLGKGDSKTSIKLDLRFGIAISVLAGMCYGLYSAFISLAMNRGIWSEWKGAGTVLSKFAVIYIVGALGTALNDSISAIWAWIIIIKKRKFRDVFEALKTKHGKNIVIAAIIGAPIAGTTYITALQMSGPVIIPIASLTPATGAILGRIVLKQKLNARKIFGVFICASAGFMIGMSSVREINSSNIFLGLLIALVAAFGWGLEGAIAGHSTTFIDYEIGITIRQTVSGICNFFVILPVLGILNGNMLTVLQMLKRAVTDSSIIFFIISGFFGLYAFSLWYKGNSICGAALGMACNASSFWGPFFCWLLLGVILGEKGWSVAPVVWVGAALIITGITFIALNPLDFFKKKR